MTYNSSKTGAQVDSVVDAGLPGGSTLYGVSNLLGIVSQSGGVPTGAVIERDSNANGEYVKFADGTLICTAAPVIDLTTGGSVDITYPSVDFVARPSCSLSGIAALSSDGLADAHVLGLNTVWRVIKQATGVSSSYQIGLLAIGRWF